MSVTPPKNSDVFICHSSEDKSIAYAACAVLERNRIRCWIAPRDVTPGKEWGDEITMAIERSKVLLVIFSSNANNSTFVRQEVTSAISKGLCVLPFRVQDVKPKGALDLALGNTHWLDGFSPPLEQHLERLARSIKGLLDQKGANGLRSIEQISSPIQAKGITSSNAFSRTIMMSLAAFVALGLFSIVTFVAVVFANRFAATPSTSSPMATKEPFASNTNTSATAPETADVGESNTPKSSPKTQARKAQEPIEKQFENISPESTSDTKDIARQVSSTAEPSQISTESKSTITAGTERTEERGTSNSEPVPTKIAVNSPVRMRTSDRSSCYQYDTAFSSNNSSLVPYDARGVITEINRLRNRCKVRWIKPSLPELWISMDNLVPDVPSP